MTMNNNCKYCGKEFELNPNNRKKKFCNNSCAAKYNNAKRKKNGYTTKGKTKIVKCECCGKDIEIGIHTPKNNYLCKECKKIVFHSYYKNKYKCVCKVCGKTFESRNKNSNHCSPKCSARDEKVRLKISENAKIAFKEGRNKGWVSRNIKSYPEKFWENVLNNNDINYEREHRVAEYGYFLDFLICVNNIKIDLEIDGKQHTHVDVKEHDVVRDERLKSLGYVVYRVPWNNINNENGKLLMKNKIDSFIEFLNILKSESSLEEKRSLWE